MTDETSEQDFADINEALADFAPADDRDGDGGGADGGGTADDGTADDGAAGGGLAGGDAEPELDQEQRDALEDAQRAMAEARERLAEVPAEIVVTNHVMGLYELAAIHLSATPPDLGQAALAIDAVACLVDGLGDRLGEDAPTMRDALTNIRLAFVQIKGAQQPADAAGSADG